MFNSSNATDELKIVIAMPMVDPLMFGATLAQFAICSTGLVINGFLVYTIVRHKQLRSTSCFLLMLALIVYDCLHELSLVTLPTVLTLTGTTVTLLTCFYAEAYGPFAMMNTQVIMLLISLDRFCSITMPMSYKNMTTSQWSKYYMSVLLGISAVTSLFCIYLYYEYMLTVAEKKVFCMPSDFFGPFGNAFQLNMRLFLNVATILVYLAIWLLIRCKVVNLVQNSAEANMLRSLHVLIAITLICHLSTPVGGNLILPHLQLSADAQNVVFRFVQQLTKIGQAVNGLVLYVCSSEYRQAIQKELCRIFGVIWTNNSTGIGNNNTITINGSTQQRNMGNGVGVLHLNYRNSSQRQH